MRRRRHSPYSQIESLRVAQREFLALVVLTVLLGLALNLFASLLGTDLLAWIPWPALRYGVVGAVALGLAGSAVVLLYARSESQWVQIEIQVPYHLPGDGQPRIVERESYGVTSHARRAFMRRYPANSPQLQDWLANWRRAKEEGIPFQHHAAGDNAALVQTLVLYVFHRYGQDSLGPESAYGWWKAGLPARQLTMDDLPAELGDNPFLRADQRAEEWRLWWPRDVEIRCMPNTDRENPLPQWRLKHRRYGRVEIRWFPCLSVAGQDSQVWQVLTQRLKPDRRSYISILGTRLEARACFGWTFWPGGDAFHDWATGLLAYLEEALDWGYYLSTRTDRLVAIQDQRLGWVPKGTSIWDKLQEIEGRLERLEVQECSRTEEQEQILGQVENSGDSGFSPGIEEEPTEGEALVV